VGRGIACDGKKASEASGRGKEDFITFSRSLVTSVDEALFFFLAFCYRQSRPPWCRWGGTLICSPGEGCQWQG